jgi:hypothetical protein
VGRTAKVFAGCPAKTLLKTLRSQGVGEALVLDVEVDEEDEEVSPLGEEPVLTVVFVSVLLEPAGEGFTTVVLFSDFAGGFAVSVLCSQAASREAAPATMQIYFFIGCGWKPVSG